MRTLARLCEEHGGAQHVPPIQALRSQRRKFQRSDGACDERVSDSLLLRKRFVASIAFDKEKLDDAPLFEMFSVAINELEPSRRQEPDAPPMCLLVRKAFLHHIVSWKNTRTSGYGAACCDVSWKVNLARSFKKRFPTYLTDAAPIGRDPSHCRCGKHWTRQ